MPEFGSRKSTPVCRKPPPSPQISPSGVGSQNRGSPPRASQFESESGDLPRWESEVGRPHPAFLQELPIRSRMSNPWTSRCGTRKSEVPPPSPCPSQELPIHSRKSNSRNRPLRKPEIGSRKLETDQAKLRFWSFSASGLWRQRGPIPFSGFLNVRYMGAGGAWRPRYSLATGMGGVFLQSWK